MLPSPVCTSTASWRRWATVPGSPRSPGPAWASNTASGTSQSVVRTPGDPSAARIRRTIVAVSSDHEKWRSVARIAGRSVPITSGSRSSKGSGSNASSAAFSTTSAINSIAASAMGPLYRLLLADGPASIGNVRVPQIGPASISSTACSAVTPQRDAPSVIAQSSEDGPRSPFGPGWMMIVRTRPHTSAGTRSRRNGQMIRSGSNSRTAEDMTASSMASSTVTSWPRARSASHARWLRPLNAEQSRRTLIPHRPSQDRTCATPRSSCREPQAGPSDTARGE